MRCSITDPGRWYLDCEPPKPPPRELAPDEVKVALRRIGETALRGLPLDEDRKRAVRKVLIELGNEER